MSVHVYRGWRSTRLHLALVAMTLISGGFALSGFKETLYDAFVMGVLGAAGIYSGAAAADRFAAGKPT